MLALLAAQTLEDDAKAALNADEATRDAQPSMVPKARPPVEVVKHVKLNVVLDDVFKRAHLPSATLIKKKKKGAAFKGAKRPRTARRFVSIRRCVAPLTRLFEPDDYFPRS